MILKRLFKRQHKPEQRLYGAIVAAARRPAFYQEMGVSDTIAGRLEMIVLHLFLVLVRLKNEGVEDLRQGLIEEFFADMDRSMRELGVSDVAVGKKVRKIAEAYYGRVMAYDRALAGEGELLQQALSRNIFPEGDSAGGAAALAGYSISAARRLAAAPLEKILQAEIEFQ